jgi:hypothetical protein
MDLKRWIKLQLNRKWIYQRKTAYVEQIFFRWNIFLKRICYFSRLWFTMNKKGQSTFFNVFVYRVFIIFQLNTLILNRSNHFIEKSFYYIILQTTKLLKFREIYQTKLSKETLVMFIVDKSNAQIKYRKVE